MPDDPADQTHQLTVVPAAKTPRISAAVAASAASIVVPAILAGAGDRAARRFLEFFAATIRNRNTRMAYLHAVGRFFAWCGHHRIGQLADIEPLHVAAYIVGQLADIEPLHVAAYIEALGGNFEKPTVKQHLAAIRMLFDWLVTGQVVATNPAHAVRGPKHVVKTGKTTVLDAEQARRLLDSMPSAMPTPTGHASTLCASAAASLLHGPAPDSAIHISRKTADIAHQAVADMSESREWRWTWQGSLTALPTSGW